MTEENPVIAIVGPGAVGGLLAWLLHRAGANVAVPRALLTSYWQAPVGEALATDVDLTNAVLAEVVACEVANGVPDTVESLATTLASLPVTMRSSLQGDLATGRPSELDAIGGELLRQG